MVEIFLGHTHVNHYNNIMASPKFNHLTQRHKDTERILDFMFYCILCFCVSVFLCFCVSVAPCDPIFLIFLRQHNS